MSRRKPLEPGCTGGIFCPVEGHVSTRVNGNGRFATGHIPLTVGQHKTLTEQARKQARQVQDVTDEHVCYSTCRRCGCCDHSAHECMGCISSQCACPAVPEVQP